MKKCWFMAVSVALLFCVGSHKGVAAGVFDDTRVLLVLTEITTDFYAFRSCWVDDEGNVLGGSCVNALESSSGGDVIFSLEELQRVFSAKNQQLLEASRETRAQYRKAEKIAIYAPSLGAGAVGTVVGTVAFKLGQRLLWLARHPSVSAAGAVVLAAVSTLISRDHLYHELTMEAHMALDRHLLVERESPVGLDQVSLALDYTESGLEENLEALFELGPSWTSHDSHPIVIKSVAFLLRDLTHYLRETLPPKNIAGYCLPQKGCTTAVSLFEDLY